MKTILLFCVTLTLIILVFVAESQRGRIATLEQKASLLETRTLIAEARKEVEEIERINAQKLFGVQRQQTIICKTQMEICAQVNEAMRRKLGEKNL